MEKIKNMSEPVGCDEETRFLNALRMQWQENPTSENKKEYIKFRESYYARRVKFANGEIK